MSISTRKFWSHYLYLMDWLHLSPSWTYTRYGRLTYFLSLHWHVYKYPEILIPLSSLGGLTTSSSTLNIHQIREFNITPLSKQKFQKWVSIHMVQNSNSANIREFLPGVRLSSLPMASCHTRPRTLGGIPIHHKSRVFFVQYLWEYKTWIAQCSPQPSDAVGHH